MEQKVRQHGLVHNCFGQTFFTYATKRCRSFASSRSKRQFKLLPGAGCGPSFDRCWPTRCTTLTLDSCRRAHSFERTDSLYAQTSRRSNFPTAAGLFFVPFVAAFFACTLAAGFAFKPFFDARFAAARSAARAPFLPPKLPTTVRAGPGLPGMRPSAIALAALAIVRLACVVNTAFPTGWRAPLRRTARPMWIYLRSGVGKNYDSTTENATRKQPHNT